jgi:CRP/FNR family transcriptional regulator, anaerobic regulatory protein
LPETLLQNINKITPLTSEEETIFLSKIEIKKFPNKTILLRSGEICKNSYFINSGLARSFTINDNITEHILSFACEGWWIGDMYSLLTQKPGHLFIEILENAEISILSKENQNQLYQEIPKLERFFRILTENSLVAHQERLLDNMSLSAEERFDKFYKKYPNLLQRIPQKHIASYIGITPEFFSKMKSHYLKNNFI